MSYQYVSSDLTDSNAIVNRQRIANKKTFKKRVNNFRVSCFLFLFLDHHLLIMSSTPSTSKETSFWVEVESPNRRSGSKPPAKSISDLKFNKINNKSTTSTKEMTTATGSTSGSNGKNITSKGGDSSNAKKNGDSSNNTTKKDGKKRALDDDDKLKKGNNEKESKDKSSGKDGTVPPPTKKPRTANENTVTCHQG